jgi:hypothetical protein
MLQNTSNFLATLLLGMQSIAKFGRMCFRSQNKITSGSERRLFVELSSA